MPQLEGDPLLAIFKIFRTIDQIHVARAFSEQMEEEEEVQWAIGTWQELLSNGGLRIEYTAKIEFESVSETYLTNLNYSSSQAKELK